MDEPSPPPLICRVCETANAGRHYGSVCCSGCKGFFRRSIRFRKTYSCPRSRNCPINKIYRNSCRACRLQKCIAAGLNPQLVQGDWGHRPNSPPSSGQSDADSQAAEQGAKKAIKPQQTANAVEKSFPTKKMAKKKKREKEEEEKRDGSPSSTQLLRQNHQMLNRKMATQRALGPGNNFLPELPSDHPNGGPADEFNSIGQFLVHVERFCDLFVNTPEQCTIDSVSFDSYKFNLDVPIQLAYKQPGMICDRFPMGWSLGKLTHTSSFARCYSRLLVHYFDWASHLPEFTELAEEDRITLIGRRATRCIYLLLCFRAAQLRGNAIPMSCDRFYPLDPVEQQKLEPQMRGMFSDTIDMAMHGLVQPMRQHNVSEMEYALIRAICLFTPVQKLTKEGNRQVLRAREKYLAALNQLIVSRGGDTTKMASPATDFMSENVRRTNRLLMLLARTEQVAQMDDNAFAMLTAFNIAQMRGNLTYELHLREKI